MSEEMAVIEGGNEPRVNGEPTPVPAADAPEPDAEPTTAPAPGDEAVADEQAAPAQSPLAVCADETSEEAIDGAPGDSERPPASADQEEFKGFEPSGIEDSFVDYRRELERMGEELASEEAALTPLRSISVGRARARGPPPAKRARRDLEGSRPGSSLSSRSEGEASSAPGSPSARRRAPPDLGSALLRAPLEAGWRRELVFRAAIDTHSRRNADVYYYTPNGKKLRSTREIAENLSGTGFTLDHFSFFKEAIGVDDPEKEIIRDAKVLRRMESPHSPAVAAIPVEGKRTPKPKAPKGVSPPPAPASTKIKVKSVGVRLSRSGSGGSPAPAPVSGRSDNNNSTPWKKTRPSPGPPPALTCRPPESPLRAPPLQYASGGAGGAGRRPCSLACAGAAGAVPALACAACLCLYHPQCQNLPRDYRPPPRADFLCKACGGGAAGVSALPPPPPLVHKSGAAAPPPAPPAPRRVLLRMRQVSEGGGSGARVWAVARPPAPPAPPVQSVALLNGRRFIVVQRTGPAPGPGPRTAPADAAS